MKHAPRKLVSLCCRLWCGPAFHLVCIRFNNIPLLTLLVCAAQLQTRCDEWAGDQSDTCMVPWNDITEVTWMGFRNRRCSDIRYCSVRGLLFYRGLFVRVCARVLDLCLPHYMDLYESLHGELSGENNEALVVCGGKEVRQRFNSTPLPTSSDCCGPVSSFLLVSTCEIGSSRSPCTLRLCITANRLPVIQQQSILVLMKTHFRKEFFFFV